MQKRKKVADGWRASGTLTIVPAFCGSFHSPPSFSLSRWTWHTHSPCLLYYASGRATDKRLAPNRHLQ